MLDFLLDELMMLFMFGHLMAVLVTSMNLMLDLLRDLVALFLLGLLLMLMAVLLERLHEALTILNLSLELGDLRDQVIVRHRRFHECRRLLLNFRGGNALLGSVDGGEGDSRQFLLQQVCRHVLKVVRTEPAGVRFLAQLQCVCDSSCRT